VLDGVKPIIWMGSSRKDLKAFPAHVRRDIGHALYTAQQGETDPAAKPLKGFGGSSVMEIVDRHGMDTYRAVHTTQFAGRIYVLHAFQKKSKKGVATPQKEIELIKKRLTAARTHYKERQNRP
jgi:phage-related protein